MRGECMNMHASREQVKRAFLASERSERARGERSEPRAGGAPKAGVLGGDKNECSQVA